MIWVALWIVLLAGACLFLGKLGLDVYRKGRALLADVGEATARLEAAGAPLQAATEELEERRELAVFADPHELRRARTKGAKGRGGVNTGHRHNGRHRSEPTTNRFGASSPPSTRADRGRTT